MGYPTKIATCCFCGSRAALRLDKGRHELACASCGAPLRDMKMLPRTEKPVETGIDHAVLRRFPAGVSGQKPMKPKKKTHRKKFKRESWFKEAAEELFDLIDDIFD
ncbi:MAG: hypothetical protein HKN30_14410 [Sulfitobacter sp.]|nr:hypothetical protein [Sulfitobacter sp.]